MPLIPPPCLNQNCHSPAFDRGYCSEHQPPAFQGNFRKSRFPKNWESLRVQVLKRDNFICYLCGNPGADGVDHIKPNDDNSLDNLAAVHDKVEPYCHRAKTAQEATLARKNQLPARFGSTMLEQARERGLL